MDKSKIRIGITKKGLEFIKNYVKSRLGETEYLTSYMNNYIVFAEKDNFIFFGWDWINFHDEGFGVSEIYEALDIMKKIEVPYRVIKVDEDYLEYDAVEIIDMDPFESIPYIYPSINVTLELENVV